MFRFKSRTNGLNEKLLVGMVLKCAYFVIVTAEYFMEMLSIIIIIIHM